MGCLLDLDAGTMTFTLNGKSLGTAFTDLKVEGGLFPGVTLRSGQQLQFNFGGSSLCFDPPEGFRPYIEAVLEAKKPILFEKTSSSYLEIQENGAQVATNGQGGWVVGSAISAGKIMLAYQLLQEVKGNEHTLPGHQPDGQR